MGRTRGRVRKVTALLQRYIQRGEALDVGAGDGQLAHELSLLGYKVDAVDIDPSKCKFADTRVRQCDLMDGLPYPDASFDAVTATELIEHVEDPFKALREFSRVLKEEGLLVLSTPNIGHIEARLHFFIAGTLCRPLACRLEAPSAAKAHHHVHPMTLVELRYVLMTNGFEPLHLCTANPKRKAWLLWPMVAGIWLFVHLFWSASRRQAYLVPDHFRLILGGRNLIILSRKRMGAAGHAVR